MKTKVLFFYAAEYLGSVWTVCRQIIKHLDPERFHVYVVIEQSATGEVELDERAGLTISRWDVGRTGGVVPTARAMASLVRLVRREGIHVIHSNEDGRSATLGLTLARLGGARLLVHYHTVPSIYGPVRRNVMRTVARLADFNVGVSRFVAEEVHKLGVSARKLGFVVNGTDPTRFRPDIDGQRMRREYGIAPDEVLVVQLSRIWKEKRQEDFVRAYAIARREVPKLRGLIVGWEDPRYKGPFQSYTDEIRHVMAEEKVEGGLLIAKPRPEAAELHAAADIEVLPSIEDPCPLVVPEAMASAKPLVGARSGGIPEMIEDGVTGFLVAPCEAAPLAEKLVQLAKDARLRETLGTNARRAVEARLSEQRVAEQFAAIYSAIAQGQPVPEASRLQGERS